MKATHDSMEEEGKKVVAAEEEEPLFAAIHRNHAYVFSFEERIKAAIMDNDKIRKAADDMVKALSAARLDDEESLKMVLKIAKDRLTVDKWGRMDGHFNASYYELLKKPRVTQGSVGKMVARKKVARRKTDG